MTGDHTTTLEGSSLRSSSITKRATRGARVDLPSTVLSKLWEFAWTFDQRLYASPTNPAEGFGLFGQFGISDGNPTRLYWSLLGGVSGTGMVPGRPDNTWGLGLYYDTLSPDLVSALERVTTIGDKWGTGTYYDFNLTRPCRPASICRPLNRGSGHRRRSSPASAL